MHAHTCEQPVKDSLMGQVASSQDERAPMLGCETRQATREQHGCLYEPSMQDGPGKRACMAPGCDRQRGPVGVLGRLIK
jgi:hypothetical protein